ncbi:accessory Sec system protein translocase subunit SecY2 [Macrococcus animalis]|uniref:accessory Sec system protein translocase subunit SecY2 n=1 Tax=Macrococcus animalis TaxID=3395467 RepID=UPI0039BE40EB
MTNHYIEINERKNIIKRILFTCFILIIFIFGNHIQILHTPAEMKIDKIYKMTASNMGGNFDIINIFSLGLGPWLTSMIFISLYYYKFPKKIMKLTQFQRSIREKSLTLLIAILQSYFLVEHAFEVQKHQNINSWTAMLVLVSGSMMLMWIADINTIHGIAGAMPIVFISLVKSFIKQSELLYQFDIKILVIAGICIFIAFVTLLIMELAEYRIHYLDIMTVSKPYQTPYISWKMNSSGSLAIMITIALFISLKYVVDLIRFLFLKNAKIDETILGFTSPVGISIFIAMLFFLTYWLSTFMINPKNKAEMFQKSGNYFDGIEPGKETERFIKQKTRRVSFFGASVVTIIIGLPLFATLLYPKISIEIFFAIQILMVVYIALNMVEYVKTLLYFDKYEGFLKKYW